MSYIAIPICRLSSVKYTLGLMNHVNDLMLSEIVVGKSGRAQMVDIW